MIKKAFNLFLKISNLASLFFFSACSTKNDTQPLDAKDYARNLSEVLQVDSSLLMGTLDNGLRYYIHKNAQPQQQAVIQLCVNAGSIDEQEHEQGIAHLLEHVALKGSTNFNTFKEFNDYFSSHGVQFAVDSNAYTSFDETIYVFSIPTTNQELLAKTIAALGDFAGRAFLREDAIKSEQPIIFDELKLRNTLQFRNLKLIVPALLQGTQYPERFPIGTVECIKNASQSTVRSFYDSWYRPDNQAIIAVGDFDQKAVLELIKKEFGSLQNRSTNTNLEKTTQQATPQYGSTVFSIDKENGLPALHIYFHQPENRLTKVSDLENLILKVIATNIINRRIQACFADSASSLAGGSAAFSLNMFKNHAFASIAAVAKDKKLPQASQEIMQIIKQIVDHGVSATELSWAKTLLTNMNNQQKATVGKFAHNPLLQRYTNHFKFGYLTDIAAIKQAATLENRIIHSVTLEAVNRLVRELFDFNKVIYNFLLNDASYEEIGKDAGKAIIQEIIKTEVHTNSTAYSAPENIQPNSITLSTQEASGEEVTAIQYIDAQKITLANGIVVYYKNSNYPENFINLNGSASGGLDCLQDRPYLGRLAPLAITAMGFGGIKPSQWPEILKEKVGLGVAASIDTHSRNVAAASRKEDFFFCLNLLRELMTNPNRDEEIYKQFQEHAKVAIRNKQNLPQALFEDATTNIIFKHPTYLRPNSIENVDAVAIDDAITLYKQAFSSINEFVFSVCGNITLEELIPLLNKTLGVVPTSNTTNWQTTRIDVTFDQGAIRKDFDKKSQQQTMTYVTFSCPQEVSYTNQKLTKIYEVALNKRLFEVLRSNNNSVYSTNAQILHLNEGLMGLNDSSYRLKCFFSCNTASVPAVTDLLLNELRLIQVRGFTEEELTQAKQVVKNQLTQWFTNNSSWNVYIIDRHLRNNQQFDSLETLLTQVDTLTPELINHYAQSLIDPNHYFAHTLVAEA